jgi:putative oxidoreductase
VKIVLLIARLILGAIFLYAAWAKLREPWWMFAASIDSYQMLPPAISIFIARTLPWLELVLGALLVIGFRLRWVAPACGVLLLVFWISMLRAWMKGMEIDCGCFGPGEAVSPFTLLRDGAMIALAAFVVWGTTRTPSNAYPSAIGQKI